MVPNQRLIGFLSLLVAFVILVATALNKTRKNTVIGQSFSDSDGRDLLYRESDGPKYINEEEYIQYLAKKLAPQNLNTWENSETGKTTLQMHQFLHLHHMKTGGTSMDGLVSCAMNRLKRDVKEDVAYMNIHECGLEHYRRCRDEESSDCRDRINNSAILSYCAPLMDLGTFGWKASDDLEGLNDAHLPNPKPHAVTVLRHPVNRVWSMFRFRTKSCYKCTPLKDVYAAIDAGNKSEITSSEICISQLSNHQTRNLMSQSNNPNLTEFEMLEDAIYSLKNFFTMVGLTEEMGDTAAMVGQIFPWMNETIPESNTTCAMPHKNASPKNNGCGKDGEHWDLPSEPDNETRAAIEKHNALDIKLYEQAVQQFHYQKLALKVEMSESE
mmetsp:Transcript_19710/g.29251  ORF Transcript_19710/g.29251 Transcript_19710/m.29251 type:complete len:384 (+) Transcript_19710:59-1210(+)